VRSRGVRGRRVWHCWCRAPMLMSPVVFCKASCPARTRIHVNGVALSVRHIGVACHLHIDDPSLRCFISGLSMCDMEDGSAS
jgi:hypothetical protein